MVSLRNYHRVVESAAAEAYTCTPEMSRNAHAGEKGTSYLKFRTLVAAARKFPGMWNKLYEATMLEEGYKYVATGNEQLVVAQGKTAVKIDRTSLDLDPEAQQSRVVAQRELYELARLYFSRHVLPQTVQVESVPLHYATEAVVTRQPLVDIAVHDLYQEPEELYQSMTEQGIDSYYVSEQMSTFCKTTKNVRYSEGFTPDIGGRGNLVVDTDSNLVLLDSYLITAEFRARPSIKPCFGTIEQEHNALTDKLESAAKMLMELSGVPIY